MNHNAREPSVNFTIADTTVSFFAARDLAANDELHFDYGEEFWDGRSEKPLNDDRIYSTTPFEPVFGIPLSRAALREVLWTRASKDEKKAAIMRALDYFGVSQSEIPVSRFFLWRSTVAYDQATLRQLATALRVQLRRADRLDNDDDDDVA